MCLKPRSPDSPLPLPLLLPPPRFCLSRQEVCKPRVVDGVRCCVGKVQAVSRHSLEACIFSPDPTVSEHQQQHLVVCWTPGGWLVARTSSTPSSLDSTGSGVFHQQHRPLSAVSHCSPSGALHVCSICILRRSLCLFCLQAIIDKQFGKNRLFERTITAHCSVPMPKRLSDKAGPSD